MEGRIPSSLHRSSLHGRRSRPCAASSSMEGTTSQAAMRNGAMFTPRRERRFRSPSYIKDWSDKNPPPKMGYLGVLGVLGILGKRIIIHHLWVPIVPRCSVTLLWQTLPPVGGNSANGVPPMPRKRAAIIVPKWLKICAIIILIYFDKNRQNQPIAIDRRFAICNSDNIRND